MAIVSWAQFLESQQYGRAKDNKNNGKRTKEEEIAYGKDSNFNFIFKSEGYTINPGIHASAQAKDRRPDLSKDDWKKLHRKVIWFIKDNKLKYGTYLFYNEQIQQGYVADINNKEIKVVTVLPRGKYFPKNEDGVKTELALVEELQENMLDEGLLLESLDTLQLIFV